MANDPGRPPDYKLKELRRTIAANPTTGNNASVPKWTAFAMIDELLELRALTRRLGNDLRAVAQIARDAEPNVPPPRRGVHAPLVPGVPQQVE